MRSLSSRRRSSTATGVKRCSHGIQRIAHERVMFAPIWELAFLNGVGPRVEEAGFGLIQHHPYSSPYEDLKLKAR